jgi:hypothetical protein
MGTIVKDSTAAALQAAHLGVEVALEGVFDMVPGVNFVNLLDL